MEGLSAYLEKYCVPAGWFAKNSDRFTTRDALKQAAIQASWDAYGAREAEAVRLGHPIDALRRFERQMLLSCVDLHWETHIDDMDQLRDGIGLRAYGQKDPIVEYRYESYEMFETMVRRIREDTLAALFHRPLPRSKAAGAQSVKQRKMQAQLKGSQQRRAAASQRAGAGGQKPRSVPKKFEPNKPCPCGSGLKFKKCCGKEA